MLAVDQRPGTQRREPWAGGGAGGGADGGADGEDAGRGAEGVDDPGGAVPPSCSGAPTVPGAAAPSASTWASRSCVTACDT